MRDAQRGRAVAGRAERTATRRCPPQHALRRHRWGPDLRPQVRLQAGRTTYEGAADCLRRTVRSEGLPALWKAVLRPSARVCPLPPCGPERGGGSRVAQGGRSWRLGRVSLAWVFARCQGPCVGMRRRRIRESSQLADFWRVERCDSAPLACLCAVSLMRFLLAGCARFPRPIPS